MCLAIGVRGEIAVFQEIEPGLLIGEPAEAASFTQGGFGAPCFDPLASQEPLDRLPEQLECELEALDGSVDGKRIVLGNIERLSQTIERARDCCLALRERVRS
jgi:hypothetical protein